MKTPPSWCKSAGFTLLELLVVLAIAGMLISLVQPLYSAAVPGARFRAEVHDLAVAIRASRNRAILSGESISIRIDEEALTYSVNAEPPLALTAARNLRLGAALASPAMTTAADRRATGDTSKSLVFFSDGSSSGGSVHLQGPGSAYVITVDWLTGRVRVQATEHELT